MNAPAIFEIFTAHDGRTQGYRHGEAAAARTCERINPVGPDGLLRKGAPFHDYLPAAKEGFWLVDDRGFVVGRGPCDNREHAERRCAFENMASDTRTFSVVEHRL